ncbi:hypothetical protein QQP08_002451 [Theobroma cacao]|nr:hypothetical protein QQP08_002451 [Theobroma cacao]
MLPPVIFGCERTASSASDRCVLALLSLVTLLNPLRNRAASCSLISFHKFKYKTRLSFQAETSRQNTRGRKNAEFIGVAKDTDFISRKRKAKIINLRFTVK